MTKFKVGDRVQILGYRDLGEFATNIGWVGVYGTVKYTMNDNVGIYSEEGNDWWWFHCDDLKIIESSPNTPKTYTLTPYIKPETVTIKGVEYIMTESV